MKPKFFYEIAPYINCALDISDGLFFELERLYKINNLDSFYSLFNSFLESNNIFIQIFSIDNLIRNITKHVLVPTMRIISEDEKEIVKKKYTIENNSNMPLILKSDPSAMFYGVKSGDFVEITRTSETSGIYICYRYCE